MTQKSTSREDLIAQLSEELTPVRRLRTIHGVGLLSVATAISLAASIAFFGFWFGIIEGQASGYFWIISGLLLILGSASASGAIAGAQPRVGSRGHAPMWGAAMLSVVPLAALIGLYSGGDGHAHHGLHDHSGWICAISSITAGSLVALAAVIWLRRGAPVSVERSGWLTGLAAGALGTLAYGVTCPDDTLAHIGLWHMVPVAVWAVLGRLIVPPLIRW